MSFRMCWIAPKQPPKQMASNRVKVMHAIDPNDVQAVPISTNTLKLTPASYASTTATAKKVCATQ